MYINETGTNLKSLKRIEKVTNKKKIIGGSIVAIVLGAIGSGVYELSKSLLWGVWKFVLTISTLGMTSLRDGLYADAAQLSYGMIPETQLLLIFALVTLVTSTFLFLNYLNEPRSKFSYLLFGFMIFPFALSFMILGIRSTYVEKIYESIPKLVEIQ